MWKPAMEYAATGVIPYGFRGDPFLLYTVDNLIQHGITTFIETGSFYGTTLRYMAQSYPDLVCYSCEPNQERFLFAQSATSELQNCILTQEASPQLLQRLAGTDAIDEPTLFWLDAHGYGFDWPLRDEIEIITRHWKQPFILIDDLRVPGHPWFAWDEYGPQECSYSYIRDLLVNRQHQVWYPNYPIKIVTGWPQRGWGLIVFNPHNWTPDQWLISRTGIETVSKAADLAVQKDYWYSVLNEIEHIGPQNKDAWTRLAQQAPNWFVADIIQHLYKLNLVNSSAWIVCIRRLASLGEIQGTVDLLSKMPYNNAEQSWKTFSAALSSNLKAATISRIHDHISEPSRTAILALITDFNTECETL